MGRIAKGSRAPLPAVALVVVTLVGVGGVPAGVRGEPRTGLLPAAACERYEELRAVDVRLTSRDVFELDRDELAEVQSERRALVRDLAGRTTGDLRAFLRDLTRWQGSFDAAILDDWEAERGRLADEGWTSWHWRRELVDEDEIRDVEGEVVAYDDVGYYHSYIDQRLAVECYAPELVDGPPEDLAGDPPEGELVYVRPDERRGFDTGGELSLHTAEAGGGRERRLPPRPYRPTGVLDVRPAAGEHEGEVLAAVSDERGRHGVAVLGPAGVTRRTAAWGAVPVICPSWDGAGDRFLVLDDVGAPAARLHLVELGREPERLDLPVAATGCADFVSDDRLVVAEAAREPGDDGVVWTVGVDGSDPERLYTAEGCNPQVGGVDPAGERVAIAQSCGDVVSSGVLVVDLASGEATRVVTGYAALPKWSPSGRWLAFGFIPLGQREPVGVWIARADGTGLRRAVDGPASFPGWLPG